MMHLNRKKYTKNAIQSNVSQTISILKKTRQFFVANKYINVNALTYKSK